MKKYTSTKFLLFIFAIYLTIFPCDGFSEPDKIAELDYVLKNVEKKNSEIISIKAEITITSSIPLLEHEETSIGILTYQKPKKFYIKFKSPQNEINIINGNDIWIYHVDEKQVEKFSMDDTGNSQQSGSFFDFGLDNSLEAIKNQYAISLIDHENGLYNLNLTPNNQTAMAQYTKINLAIDDKLWMPTNFELFESNGEKITIINLKNIAVNIDVSSKIFEFNAPKDVVIVEPF